MNEIPTSEAIIQKFGLKYDDRFECVPNAIFNFTRIILNQTQGEPPKIYFHIIATHVYLVFEGNVFSKGITGPIDRNTDFSLDQLEDEGDDVTAKSLEIALTDKKMQGYLEQIFPKETLVIAVPKLQQIYAQLT